MATHKIENVELSHIYSGILAGADNIVLNCDELNRANGFPVPDMDTGNNLSFLMSKITSEIERKKSIKEFMEGVSDLAMQGARGNSGAIFSQFFYGFEKMSPDTDIMQKDGLVDCFYNAYEYAYKAIKDPVEGTIITAIRSFAEALKVKAKESVKVEELLEYAYNSLKKTVTDTKFVLPEQVAIGKEDAGAKAFLLFIEGFIEMVSKRVSEYTSTSKVIVEKPVFEESIHHVNTAMPKERYCTEVLVKKHNQIEFEEAKRLINDYGDSLVISENSRFIRFHIHTNKPADVVKKISKIGDVLEVKADDMKSQVLLSRETEKRTALIIDSIADLPTDNLPDYVFQMPLNLLVDKVLYQDKRTVYPELLQKGRASSAQPNIEEIKRFLDPIAAAYENVIVLSVSQKMSGVHDRFVQAAERYGEKVTVIDTKLNSVAEGLIAEKAIKAIGDGAGVEEIVETLHKRIATTKIFVSLPNLKAMVSSGRLNERVGYFLQKLGFLPLITINSKGEGALSGVAFSKNKNEKLLFKQMEKVKNNIEEYAVVHAEDYDRALRISKQIEEIVGKPPIYIDEISSVVKIFSGKGSVAVGYVERS